ncbi:SET and MYND domain-containing protein 4 isoform X2 [Anabrus simplex]|uniref:SET and MYND domain-containing protein 4 isoform X2 n=1 Tax=Anabrus simplex TaxID=316456 RepID=UPI0035A3A7A6
MAFDSLINSVREAVKMEEMLDKFGKLTTDKERIEYVEKLTCVRELVLGENFGQKSEAKAVELLDQGKTLLSKNKTWQAITRFTQAVKLSLPSSAVLTQSFLARSRALYAGGSYQEAAEDARRCVSDHLTPLDVLGAIQLEARCQLQLGLKTQAEATLQRALQLLRSSALSNEQKACVAKELAQDMKNTKQLRTKEPKCTGTDTIPQLDYGQNPTIPAASAALKLCWTEEKGRQLVANRDIKMGSVLIVERPYAWSLSTEAMAEHCLHCCRLNKAPLPCRQCSTLCDQQSSGRYIHSA